jgi:hypothetical protein
MNKTILIIAIVVAAVIGGGYILINSNPGLKAKAEKMGIIDYPPVAPVPPVYNAVNLIFDPSGSGISTYSIPKISIIYISSIIDSIAKYGTGELWLSYIDKDAYNNKVLHFKITSAIKPIVRPIRQSGERKGDFDKRIVIFQNDSLRNVKNAEADKKAFEIEKKKFLSDCQAMINEGFSDCIGSLNAALRSLETVQHDSLHYRTILFISDGVQDLPKDVAPQKLNPIAEDIRIITVNQSGSKNNVVKDRDIEVDNIDRGLEKAIQHYNH